MRREYSLDGLRGIAVLLVFLHHHAWFQTGWVGVDLFFGLSGYLITSILRSTREDTHFWREFWTKRVTRIFPASLVLLLLTFVLRFSLSFGMMLAYVFSLGDVLSAKEIGPEPLKLMWSLAVEEHFYFVWPFAVRNLSRRTLIWILLSLVTAEPILRGVFSFLYPAWKGIYFLTVFRLDGIALGSLLALLLESKLAESSIKKWSLPAGVAAVAGFAGLRHHFGSGFHREWPGLSFNVCVYSLFAVASVSLIAYLLTHKGSLLARALSLRGLVFFGTISYGLYLYQVLVKVFVMEHTSLKQRSSLIVALPLTIAIAWLSYVFFESPITGWGKRKAKELHGQA